MPSDADEIVEILETYRSRGRIVDAVRWNDEHLAGRAVVIETARSVYIFVPVYGGKQFANAPGGSFRFAGFDAATRNDPPRLLLGRPYNVQRGQPLEISLAKQQRHEDEGVTIGLVATDTRRTVATSRVERIRVLSID